MAKKKTIGIKRLREICNAGLKDVVGGCLFGYIIEQDDPIYCQRRAMELLTENTKIIDTNKIASNLDAIICLVASAKAIYGATKEN